MISLLIFIVLLFQSLPLIQHEEYVIRNFTVQDGLPVNSVYQMVQDDEGYIWFRTLDGLVRYDGYEFRVFNFGNTEGLYSNRVADMLKTSGNELWLIHVGGGAITRKTGSSFIPYSSVVGDFKGDIFRVIETKNGGIWISTTEGIAEFNPQTESFEMIDVPLLQSRTWAIEATFDGGIIVMNENGLVIWKNGIASLLIPIEKLPIPGDDVVQIKHVKEDEVWVMGDEGLFRYSLSEKRINYTYIDENEEFSAWNLHFEEDGTVIINSTLGFYLLDPELQTVKKLLPEVTPFRIRTNLVYRGPNNESIRIGDDEVLIDGQNVLQTDDIISAFLDREGSLWVSTWQNGVFQIRRSDISNITQNEIPGFRNIYPVIQLDDGTIWAGSFGGGIFRISGDSITNWTEENSSLTSNLGRFVYQDSNDTIYAGLWNQGLWMYRNDDWEHIEDVQALTVSDVTIEAMHRDRSGRLFIGTSDQLVLNQNQKFKRFDEAAGDAFRAVCVIKENSNGTLFFGTTGYGLTILSDGETANYTTQNSQIPSDFIRDIYMQSADTLWLAMDNFGLTRVTMSPDGLPESFFSIIDRDGLVNNSLHRIIETPDGQLWISSNGGIMRISKDELNQYADGETKNLTVVAFNEQNGMSNREANGGVQTAGFLSADQKLWFPNQAGITVIDPSQMNRKSLLPDSTPIIETIAFSDSLMLVDEQSFVEIPIGERDLRIKFTSPNFSSPKRLQFQYQLQGVNTDWQKANIGREAQFTNIPPGIHQFQVMTYPAGNTSDVSVASLLITVPSYFYETVWFKILLGLIGLLTLFGGIKYRTRVLELRERKLREQVDQQTIELQEAAEQKSRFFSGITHELKTPLSLIIGPLEDILDDRESLFKKTTQKRLDLMHRNSHKLKQLVDQILDVTKLNADAVNLTLRPVNFTRFTQQITGQFQSKLDQEYIRLIFESDEVAEPIYLDESVWERIVINLLSNAIRFSPNGSTIWMTIHDHESHVELSVKDEGIGIDKDELENIFKYLYQVQGADAAGGTGIGLYQVRGLTEHMGGSVRVKSKKGDGAEFIVTLKKGFKHFQQTDTISHDLPNHKTATELQSSGSYTDGVEGDPSGSSAHILVVEDNTDFRAYLLSVLAKRYRVSTAREGGEAFDVLKTGTIDLVISDIMMPGMNGLEFVRNLRSKEKYKRLPVIFLSAKDQEMDVETGLSSGADIYLTKPVKRTMLLSQISAVLRREEVLASSRSSSASEEPEFVTKIREIIYRQMANPVLNVNSLADTLFMSRTTLYREWKKVSDVHLNEFIRRTRLEEAKTLLTEEGFGIQEAAAAVGYSDPNYFSTSFKKEFGVSPSEMMQ